MREVDGESRGDSRCVSAYEFSRGFSGTRDRVEAQCRGKGLVVWETVRKTGGCDGCRVRVFYAQSARPTAADPLKVSRTSTTPAKTGEGLYITPATTSRSRGTCWQPSATRKAAAGAGAAAAGAAAATAGATLQSRGSWRVVVIRTRTHTPPSPKFTSAHAHTRTGVVVYIAGDAHKQKPCTAIESEVRVRQPADQRRLHDSGEVSARRLLSLLFFDIFGFWRFLNVTHFVGGRLRLLFIFIYFYFFLWWVPN